MYFIFVIFRMTRESIAKLEHLGSLAHQVQQVPPPPPPPPAVVPFPEPTNEIEVCSQDMSEDSQSMIPASQTID